MSLICLMIAYQKRILYGWLPQTTPTLGVKLRWHDKANKTRRVFQLVTSGTIELKTDFYRKKEGLKSLFNQA